MPGPADCLPYAFAPGSKADAEDQVRTSTSVARRQRACLRLTPPEGTHAKSGDTPQGNVMKKIGIVRRCCLLHS